MKKLFLLAALAILPTQAFAMFGCGCCDGGFADGFRAGVFGAFSRIDYRVFTCGTDETDPAENVTFEADTIQRAQGGGGFIGYACPVWGCWGLAAQFDATWNGDNARYTLTHGDLEEVLELTLRNRYILDLSVQPQVYITQCFAAYFKFGVSWADLHMRYRMINDDTPYQLHDQDSRKRTSTGYVLGAGFRAGITCWLSAFGEFNWRRFDSSLPRSKRLVDPTSTDETSRAEVTQMLATTYVFGLMASF